jgi:thiol-disulfide isomerase/thioredoxin
MVNRNAGKALFATVIVLLVLSVGALSYLYLQEGQEAWSGTDDDADDTPDTGDDGEQEVQNLAPDFTYAAVDGGTVSLSGLRGKVVVLDFMATWCGPCRSQIQNLNQIYGEYSGDGVIFVSIDVDARETPAELLAFRSELGATWHFVIDGNGIGSLPVYNAASIPTMVFINKQGQIANRDVGLMSVDALRDAIDPLL